MAPTGADAYFNSAYRAVNEDPKEMARRFLVWMIKNCPRDVPDVNTAHRILSEQARSIQGGQPTPSAGNHMRSTSPIRHDVDRQGMCDCGRPRHNDPMNLDSNQMKASLSTEHPPQRPTTGRKQGDHAPTTQAMNSVLSHEGNQGQYGGPTRDSMDPWGRDTDMGETIGHAYVASGPNDSNEKPTGIAIASRPESQVGATTNRLGWGASDQDSNNNGTQRRMRNPAPGTSYGQASPGQRLTEEAPFIPGRGSGLGNQGDCMYAILSPGNPGSSGAGLDQGRSAVRGGRR